MRENGLNARAKKAFGPRTTTPGLEAAPNLIKQIKASGSDQIWVSDITYVVTLERWLYLAVILDLFSCRVVGWKLGQSLESKLVVTALRNVLVLRQPQEGLYFHSDRGWGQSEQRISASVSLWWSFQCMKESLYADRVQRAGVCR